MTTLKKKQPAKKRSTTSRRGKNSQESSLKRFIAPAVTAAVCVFAGIAIGHIVTKNHMIQQQRPMVVTKILPAPKPHPIAKVHTPAVKPAPKPEFVPKPILKIEPVSTSKPAWQAFAVPYDNPKQKPEIAIVIDDMGVDRKHSEQVVELRPKLTLAFLPYGSSTKRLSQQARRKGFELLVHVPMEPLNGKIDAGPHCLRTRDNRKQVKANLDWCLNQFDGYVGINNHMGSKFTAQRGLMKTVMKEMQARGLLFLDSRTNKRSQGYRLAKQKNLPAAERHIFLDHVATDDNVKKQLKRLKAIALEQGYAVAIGHPKAVTINALSRWIPQMEKEGFSFAPISAIAGRNM